MKRLALCAIKESMQISLVPRAAPFVKLVNTILTMGKILCYTPRVMFALQEDTPMKKVNHFVSLALLENFFQMKMIQANMTP
jgi:hypothetical protein